ncbi:MAG: hypothetical protein ACLFVU_03105 [Phycisphaerae bacterium]
MDFSGAENAGTKIWIASGRIHGRQLLLSELIRADELPDSGPGRSACMPVLRRFITDHRSGLFGVDFPLTLPKQYLGSSDWRNFVHELCYTSDSPQIFRKRCIKLSGGKELKRHTERRAQVPFSAVNLRLYKQTYYGLKDLIAPLVESDKVRVLPYQPLAEDKPAIVEICPASSIKDIQQHSDKKLYAPYKGDSPGHRKAREDILAYVERTGLVSLLSWNLRWEAIEDPGGDALDAVLAAYAATKAMLGGRLRAEGDPVEGEIYY